uniref:Uncharacterized protein n=1 Tax=Romanomermis culicivorax TaxID=13658 RepID=A0A915KUT2_ROMCU
MIYLVSMIIDLESLPFVLIDRRKILAKSVKPPKLAFRLTIPCSLSKSSNKLTRASNSLIICWIGFNKLGIFSKLIRKTGRSVISLIEILRRFIERPDSSNSSQAIIYKVPLNQENGEICIKSRISDKPIDKLCKARN